MARNVLMGSLPVIILSACGSNEAGRKEEAKSPAPAAAPALPVDIKIAKEEVLDQAETIAGTILPNKEVMIMSELTKKISSVNFTDGSFVNSGQVLYQLDDADIQARIRQLKADLNLATINERRLYNLLQSETVRQEEYDVANTKLQSLQAAMQALQVELSKTTIRAPFSGRIGITKVYPGTLVSPGMPLVTLQDQATAKINFAVSEKYLKLARTGNSVQFATDVDQVKRTARIIASEAGINANSRSIELQAVAPNGDGLLKPGMSVKVSFSTNAADQKGILIPTESLIPSANGYSVFLIRNGIAKITPVTIGNRSQTEATILSGISNGDSVLTSNLMRASDGAPVQVVSSK